MQARNALVRATAVPPLPAAAATAATPPMRETEHPVHHEEATEQRANTQRRSKLRTTIK